MNFSDFVEEWLTIKGNTVLNGSRDSLAVSKYTMNYQNIWDWMKLRDSGELPKDLQTDLDLIWKGITSYPGEAAIRNCNAWGMKNLKDLNPWLLLLAGAEWRGLKSWTASPISGNVMSEQGRYSPTFGVCKLLSPRSARRESRRWFKSHRELLESSENCYVQTFTVNMCMEKCLTAEGRKEIASFWSKVTSKLRSREGKKLWDSYFYSHEVAPVSILDNAVFPHTHVVIWSKNRITQEELDQLFEGFSANLSVKNFQKDPAALSRYIEYLHAIPEWSQVYRNEWSNETSQALNIALPNILQNVLDLYWNRRKTGTVDRVRKIKL
jgi:hypothetical protein